MTNTMEDNNVTIQVLGHTYQVKQERVAMFLEYLESEGYPYMIIEG